ncbi:sialate O-acetylesterase [Rubellicoccus peritrichatus]|uniref:Sialate O-acetylesterase n=1 Tax=Rubellicoccus peritrichatus TaxID=3080537 RepID=A0AAQ3QU50_9BACT|nr:sialate O-acetylesterase [Puniceicoccus sp. CR14]WOO39615.1 sialate O-acetylesterase [Puniceicoccus sp. CR14]
MELKQIFLIVFALLFVFESHAVDVYIVAGQSNAWNISNIKPSKTGTPSNNLLYFFGKGCVDEPVESKLRVFDGVSPNSRGYGLASSLLEITEGDVVLIEYARCGAPIGDKTQWYPGDNPSSGMLNENGLYNKFLMYYDHAKSTFLRMHPDEEWNLKALFWMQGEGDSNRKEWTDNYEVNLENLILRFRSDFGDNLPIIAGYIREVSHRPIKAPLINKAMDAVAANDPLFYMVESRDLEFRTKENGEDVHFSDKGSRELGVRMVNAFCESTEGALPAK